MTRGDETMDELVALHGASASNREKAEIEKRLSDLMRSPGSKFRHEELRHLLPDTSGYDLDNRQYLLNHATDLVWSHVESGMPMALARKILFDAKLAAAASDRPLDECWQRIHRSVLNESDRFTSKSGTFYRKKPKERSNVDWTRIESMAAKLFVKELQEEGLDADSMSSDFVTDLKVLVKQYKMRATAAKGAVASRRQSSEEDDKAMRRAAISGFRELGFEAPKPGKRPDMKEIRRVHRRLAADNHPDRHPGNEHVSAKFLAVNRAYKLIEEYDEYLSRKEQ